MVGPMPRALTPRQLRWIEAMAADPSRSYASAAKVAGYTGDQNSMQVAGYRNAHHPAVAEALKAAIAARQA